jgi:hypothetical protein
MVGSTDRLWRSPIGGAGLSPAATVGPAPETSPALSRCQATVTTPVVAGAEGGACTGGGQSAGGEDLLKAVGQSVYDPELAFPDDHHCPTGRAEIALLSGIPLHVLMELCCPEIRPCLRCRCVAATGMTMPEAAMDENHGAIARQHDVR